MRKEMETATQEMRVCLGRDGAGQEDGPTGQGAAVGIRTVGSNALPRDLEAATSGNACNYTAEFPSLETAQPPSLLRPDNVRVTHVN